MKPKRKKQQQTKTPTTALNLLAVAFILFFAVMSCKDNGDPPDPPEINPCDTFDYSGIDFSNIDSLYNKPLCVIKKCIDGN
jgi:hypothetical protein